MRHLSSEQIHMKWTIIKEKYDLRSITKKDLKVPEKPKGPFIYQVITFLGFLDPSPPLRNHVFSTENNQKLAFSDPPPTLQVIT